MFKVKLFVIFIITTIAYSISDAQLRKASDYFPLKIGNIWEYKPNPDQYPDRHIEIISDTLIGDTTRFFKAIIWHVDHPEEGFGYHYYQYDKDTTIVYWYDWYEEQPKIPDSGFPILDTRNGIGHVWTYPLIEYDGAFAITDTGSAFYFDGIRHWIDVYELEPYRDSIIVAPGFYWRFADGLGPVRVGWDTLVYAKINGIEYGIPLSVERSGNRNIVPESPVLKIYPNPSHDNMQLFFDLAKKDWCEIKIINSLGQTIKVLYSGMLLPGFHSFSWNGLDKTGSRISNGIYFAVFRSSGIFKSQKFIYFH